VVGKRLEMTMNRDMYQEIVLEEFYLLFYLSSSQERMTKQKRTTQLISDKHNLHIAVATYTKHFPLYSHTATVSSAIFLRFPPDIHYLL
jgi:hypothetical protein